MENLTKGGVLKNNSMENEGRIFGNKGKIKMLIINN